MSSSSTDKSVPAILSRKRKSPFGQEMDLSNALAAPSTSSSSSSSLMRFNTFAVFNESHEDLSLEEDEENEDDCMVVASENNPSVAAAVLGSSNSLQSSRLPLSTLHDANRIEPSKPRTKLNFERVKSKSPKPGSLSSSSSQQQPPAKKRLKMRQSWFQFREFVRTSSEGPSRSATPFPTLKWADRQDMWDLICKKEYGMYERKSGPEILAQHPALQPRMRAILLDWLIEVCEVYRLHRETFYLAVDFIDRYLSKTVEMPKNRLQLIGVTSLFIGSKIEEIYPPKLSEFAYVTDGACSEEEILTMELVILKELNWGLSPMTPNAWMKMFMQVSNCDNSPDNETFVIPQYSGLPFSRVMQLLDLVMLDIGSLSFRYSVLAASALCLVLQNQQVALAASGYAWEDLAPCVRYMSAFAQALREDLPGGLQPKSFSNVPVENQHNIQTHTVELSTLDRAQERLAAQARQSPQPLARRQPLAGGSSVVEMTPPETLRDARFASAAKENIATTPPVTHHNPSASVFLSPQTPNSSIASKTAPTFGTSIVLNN